MKRNYERIIDVVLGILFIMLIFGFAQSIMILDYTQGDYGKYQYFADMILSNDKFLIGFTTASIFLCILYALFDFKEFKYGKFIQFVLSILLLGIASYIFIILTTLRNEAFQMSNYVNENAYSLYKEYRLYSLMICFSQFLLSLHAIIRSCHSYYIYRKNEEKEDNSSL